MIYERKSMLRAKSFQTVERNHTLSELVDYYYIQKQFKILL